MTLENNRVPLACYFKLCASFRNHWWIQTEVTVRKRSIRVKINDFLAVWPRNLMEDLEKRYGTSSMLLQAFCIISDPLVISNWSYSPETPNLGQNQRFFSRVTPKFDGWPRKTIGHLFYATSSFVHHTVAVSEFKLELQSGNVQFGSKWRNFFSHVILKFDGWHWKTIGNLFHATSSFVHHSVATGDFKLELQSGNTQIGSKSMIF